jgi:hypothetical protein
MEDLEQQREAILAKKLEVDAKLSTAKAALSEARRKFRLDGVPASRDWFSTQEKYIRRLGFASQELQRQVGQLKLAIKQRNVAKKGLETFLLEVVRERVGEDLAHQLWGEAVRRRQVWDLTYGNNRATD